MVVECTDYKTLRTRLDDLGYIHVKIVTIYGYRI